MLENSNSMRYQKKNKQPKEQLGLVSLVFQVVMHQYQCFTQQIQVLAFQYTQIPIT